MRLTEHFSTTKSKARRGTRHGGHEFSTGNRSFTCLTHGHASDFAAHTLNGIKLRWNLHKRDYKVNESELNDACTLTRTSPSSSCCLKLQSKKRGFPLKIRQNVPRDTSGVDASSLAIQSDEKILVGTFPFNDAAIIRYNNDGTLDSSFGTGGYVSGNGAAALAFQSDGKIVAVARSSLLRYNSAHPIMKFDPVRISLGRSFTATFSGTNMTDQTYFDVRYRYPGDDTDQVVLNWQHGLSAVHSVTTDTVVGMGSHRCAPTSKCK